MPCKYQTDGAATSIAKFKSGRWADINQADWRNLAAEVQYCYAHSRGEVTKERLRDVVLAFRDAYAARRPQLGKDAYYLGNLPKRGVQEGSWDEAVDEPMPAAINRALGLIKATNNVGTTHGNYLSRNLAVVLRDEEYVSFENAQERL